MLLGFVGLRLLILIDLLLSRNFLQEKLRVLFNYDANVRTSCLLDFVHRPDKKI